MVDTTLLEAVDGFLGSLDTDARQVAHRSFDDAHRRDWHYVPRQRAGLSLADMTVGQRMSAHRLLGTLLRPHAYAQAVHIMALEEVLDALEGHDLRRHGLDYDLVVFGEPSAEGPWGCRFEGHHLSVNVTIEDREVAATPLFFGANPARVTHRGVDVSRPLPHEEELARRLVQELPGDLRGAAVFSGDAPADILTRAAQTVDGGLEPHGVVGADLPGAARELLDALVGVYLERVSAEITVATVAGDDVFFAWAGGTQPGEPHYYRLQGPGLLIEYDNTQNGANHVHTVVRDPARDFDPLARHRAVHHG